MKKNFKKNRVIISSIIISTVWIIFSIPKKTFAEPSTNQSSYSSTLLSLLPSTAYSKKEYLKAYCMAMENETIKNWLKDKKVDALFYSPKQSIFIAVLCKPFQDKWSFYNTDLLNNKDRSEILGENLSWCDPTTDMNSCDLSILLPHLFTAVLNDHSTLSIAWWAIKWQEKEDNINEFTKTYFGNLWSACGKTDSNYITNASAGSEKDALCSHPKTYALLKSTIDWLQEQQKNLKTIDAEKFKEIQTDICKKPWEEFNNLITCAYTNTSQVEWWAMQYNIRYNELLYYKVLISWLETKLNDPNLAPLNLTKSIKVDLSDEIWRLQKELIVSQNAIQIMQRYIDNIRVTLPLHIWLYAYYEDVIAFRKSLVKVYTPIHQLYYKLRNIQEKN